MILENVYGLSSRFEVAENPQETSERQILNLIYSYSWLLDAAQFDAIAELFADADIYMEGELTIQKDGNAFAQSFRDFDQVHEDGTLKTMHLVIDPIIHIDEEAGTATADHYTVVVQGITGVFGPQVICMDKKFDTFKRDEKGLWHFASRNMVNRAVGDISHHGKYSFGKAE